MPDSDLDTAFIQGRLERWRAGDAAAIDELVSMSMKRLELLARQMMRGFHRVRSLADTDDVLQGALLRLVQALRAIQPTTSRDFINLAAVQIRRELLDLARRIQARPEINRRGDNNQSLANVPTETVPADELDHWRQFHEAVEALPVEQREAFGLVYYHGWPHDQIAKLFDVDKRTIRRRWRAACDDLKLALGERLPIHLANPLS